MRRRPKFLAWGVDLMKPWLFGQQFGTSKDGVNSTTLCPDDVTSHSHLVSSWGLFYLVFKGWSLSRASLPSRNLIPSCFALTVLNSGGLVKISAGPTFADRPETEGATSTEVARTAHVLPWSQMSQGSCLMVPLAMTCLDHNITSKKPTVRWLKRLWCHGSSRYVDEGTWQKCVLLRGWNAETGSVLIVKLFPDPWGPKAKGGWWFIQEAARRVRGPWVGSVSFCSDFCF